MTSNRPVTGLVSWFPLIAIADTMRRAGLPDEAISEDLRAAVEQARATRGFVRWEVIVGYLDQARVAFGSDTRFMDACEHFDGSVSDIKAFAPAGMTVHQLCRLILEGFDGAAYPDVGIELRPVDGERAEVEVRLPASYPDSTSWLLGSVGALRTMTRHLGLPKTQVEADLGTHHGIYRLTFPLSDRPAPTGDEQARAEDAIRMIHLLRDDVRSALTGAGSGGRSHEDRIQTLVATWKLTPRQAQVLGRLCLGLSNKDISAQLACSVRTVELHVTEILRKAGLERRSQLVARFATGG